MQKVKRYFLEIKELKKDQKKIHSNSFDKYSFYLEDNKDFKLNKFFYKQIGADHFWRDRLTWTDNDWKEYVSTPNFETWIMKKNRDLVGFYEKQFHTEENEVELINMGILKEYRGKNLGSALLDHCLQNSFNKRPKRVWVHTCSLDHRFALQNYRSRGFKIFKEEEINFVA